MEVIAIKPDDVERVARALYPNDIDPIYELCADHVVARDEHYLLDARGLGVEPTMRLSQDFPESWIERHGRIVCTFSTKIVREVPRTIAGVEIASPVARTGAAMVDAGGECWYVEEL